MKMNNYLGILSKLMKIGINMMISIERINKIIGNSKPDNLLN